MRNKLILSIIIILILGLWFSGIIPKQIGKGAAISYIEENYAEMGLMFDKMEYSSAHGDYFAIFVDINGEVYNFLMSPKLWPTTVFYDPLNNPPAP